MGFIASHELNPQKARVPLALLKKPPRSCRRCSAHIEREQPRGASASSARRFQVSDFSWFSDFKGGGPRAARQGQASANWMTTLTSSGCRASARLNSAGGSRRVTMRASHEWSVRASSCAALYQCRLFALTLPTTTLLRRTTLDAASADGRLTVRPPLPTPVRHTTPPGATVWIESTMTCPTPVHSMMTSGWKPMPERAPVW